MATFIMRGPGERFSVLGENGRDWVTVDVVRFRRGRVGMLVEAPAHLRVRVVSRSAADERGDNNS
ncbi:MAG TPA: hypothetical protein VFW87_01875 [Pirellulales bacterium]|nr:hypothetical protein [Pirellulales bacterium]